MVSLLNACCLSFPVCLGPRLTFSRSDGHYNVLVGYDHENFFLMDPSTQGHYAYIPQSEFIDRWHDIVGKNTKTERMVILVKGTRTPHPVTPKHPDATYEA